jgi:DNA repair ATPase RecN
MASKKQTLENLFVEEPAVVKAVSTESTTTLEQEIIELKKTIKDQLRNVEEISANEHSVRKLLEQAEATIYDLKEKEKELSNSKQLNKEYAASLAILNDEKEKTGIELFNKQQTINSKNQEIEKLKLEVNKLAVLFDEYILAYQDQVKMLGVFVKNTQTVEKYLSQKINEFNEGERK